MIVMNLYYSSTLHHVVINAIFEAQITALAPYGFDKQYFYQALLVEAP